MESELSCGADLRCPEDVIQHPKSHQPLPPTEIVVYTATFHAFLNKLHPSNSFRNKLWMTPAPRKFVGECLSGEWMKSSLCFTLEMYDFKFKLSGFCSG